VADTKPRSENNRHATDGDARGGAVSVADRSSERQRIIDAAYRCLDRNSGTSASINEILDEAGLATRAFYRNFSTKHDLLLEMFRRDREAVLAEIRATVARAETPVEALRQWMTHMFALTSDPRRRKRVATFYSEEMRRTPGYGRELELFATAEQAALAAILHQGRANGTFTACNPESDARSVRAAFEAAFLDRFNQKSSADAAEDVEQLLAFVLRGVGAVERDATNPSPAMVREGQRPAMTR
jgi:AcrR family transcriptional regulator